MNHFNHVYTVSRIDILKLYTIVYFLTLLHCALGPSCNFGFVCVCVCVCVWCCHSAGGDCSLWQSSSWACLPANITAQSDVHIYSSFVHTNRRGADMSNPASAVGLTSLWLSLLRMTVQWVARSLIWVTPHGYQLNVTPPCLTWTTPPAQIGCTARKTHTRKRTVRDTVCSSAS